MKRIFKPMSVLSVCLSFVLASHAQAECLVKEPLQDKQSALANDGLEVPDAIIPDDRPLIVFVHRDAPVDELISGGFEVSGREHRRMYRDGQKERREALRGNAKVDREGGGQGPRRAARSAVSRVRSG